MAQTNPSGPERADLKQSFEAELERLAASAIDISLVEGVIRLRALADIAAILDTAALLELAVRLASGAPSGES